MDLYTETDYRQAIRNRLQAMQREKKPLTLKKIAQRVRMQYTYLSKVMNDPAAHLGEERLYQVCGLLGWTAEERDYVMLLRAHSAASEGAWRDELFKRIESARKARHIRAAKQDFSSGAAAHEMAYLFDPLCKILLVALCIAAYRKNPRLLCPLLGIDPRKLKELLNKLSDAGLIALEEDGLTVEKVLKTHIHYSRDHPLMRTHQHLLKSAMQSQLMRTAEQEKHSVLATFTLDQRGFARIQDEFQQFLRKVEDIAAKSRDESVYQLSFDVFKWV